MPGPKRVALLLTCAVALRVSAAAGQTLSPSLPEPVAPVETHWYGWEMLLTDGAGVGLFTLGMEMDANRSSAAFSAMVLGLGTLAFSGPMIHAGHGSWPRAGLSFALRAGAMVVGAIVGANIRCDYAYDHEGCWVEHAIYGLVGGGAAAAVLDASLIGYERVARPMWNEPIVGFVPVPGGGGLSLGGRF